MLLQQMDVPRNYHTKWSKPEKDKYHDMPYMWNLKKKKKMIQMNLYTKQKQTHTLRKQTYGYQRQKLGEGKIRSLGLTYTHYYT